MTNESLIEKVCEYRIKHPSWTLSQIADKVDLSIPSVSKILKQRNLPIRRSKRKRTSSCDICGGEANGGKYCSNHRYGKVLLTVQCHTCGKDKEIALARYKMQTKPPYKGKFFCDRKCLGRYVGSSFNKSTKRKKSI